MDGRWGKLFSCWRLPVHFFELQGFNAGSVVQRQSDGFPSDFAHAHNPTMIEHGNDLYLYCLRIIRVALRHCDGGVACPPTSGGHE